MRDLLTFVRKTTCKDDGGPLRCRLELGLSSVNPRFSAYLMTYEMSRALKDAVGDLHLIQRHLRREILLQIFVTRHFPCALRATLCQKRSRIRPKMPMKEAYCIPSV